MRSGKTDLASRPEHRKAPRLRYWSLYCKQRRARAKAAGICVWCLRNDAIGSVYCKGCKAKQQASQERFREKRRRLRLCFHCGASSGPRAYCPKCRRCMTKAQRALTSARRRAGSCLRCGGQRDGEGLRCSTCRSFFHKAWRTARTKLRKGILERFGSACRCCGERRPEFLTLDHIFNDGKAERGNSRNSYALYRKLLKRKTISRRHQLLCWNCNEAKAHYGRCPHQAA